MNPVIKAGAGTEVLDILPFRGQPRPGRRDEVAQALSPPPSNAEPRMSALDPHPPSDLVAEELDRLRATLADRDAQIAAHDRAVEEARRAGDTAGRRAAAEEFEDNRQRALELLARGIENARADRKTLLDQAERLALLLAQTVLDKLFMADKSRAQLVADLMAHRLTLLDRESIVTIEVSAHDFPDQPAVQALIGRTGVTPDWLSVSAALAAGDCRIRMRLGAIDIGLDRQWSAIRAMLEELADHPEDR